MRPPLDQVRSIFIEALDQPPGRREAFVAARCGANAALKAEVAALLALHDAAGDPALPAPEGDESSSDLPARFGPWHIRGRLGSGGMGFVYRAFRPGIDDVDVALKVVRPGIAAPYLLARFEREIESLERLRHPGIARLIEAGTLEGPAGVQPYMAMELVEGVTLREWAVTAPSAPAGLEVLARIGDALAHAHEAGVVHRDLKPENVMIRPDDTPCVLDFGVARLTGAGVDTGTVTTSPGLIVGTIRYMSPEQAGAGPGETDARTDVYSLGVMGYELMTGRLPYDIPEESFHRALAAVLTAPAAPMKEVPVPLRRPLEAVLGRAMAKRPADRYASASDFAADLRRVALRQRPRAARVPGAARKRLAIAGVLVLAVLAVLAVPMRPSAFDWIVGMTSPATVFAQTIADLDSAYARLHLTTRTEARLEEALAYSERALSRVRTVRRQPWTPRLARFACNRVAECHFLLGERHLDPRRLRRAADYWRQAAREARTMPPVASLPDPGQRLIEHIYTTDAYATSSLLSAGMALFDAARFDEPLPLLEESRRAREAFAQEFRSAGGSEDVHQRALLLNALGETLAGIAEHSNDAAEADSAIRYLDQAWALTESHGDPSEHASLAHNRGYAYLQRSRLTGREADLDQALVMLNEALTVRRNLPGYVSQFLTRRECGNALRLAARRSDSPRERHELLKRAHRLVGEPLEGAGMDLPPASRGLVALSLAAIEIDLGCVERDSARFTVAESLLAVADHHLTLTTEPLLEYQYHRQRTRVAALRWALDRSTVRKVQALTELARARSSMWHGASMRLAREQQAAEARLRYLPPEPFGLDFPLD